MEFKWLKYNKCSEIICRDNLQIYIFEKFKYGNTKIKHFNKFIKTASIVWKFFRKFKHDSRFEGISGHSDDSSSGFTFRSILWGTEVRTEHIIKEPSPDGSPRYSFVSSRSLGQTKPRNARETDRTVNVGSQRLQSPKPWRYSVWE